MSIFSQIRVPKVKKTNFDLTFENKLSCNMGELIPIAWFDCVPGDVFKFSSELFLRFAPLISPIMHRVNARIDWYKVPYRLLWKKTPEGDGWENFISPQDVFGNGVQPEFPTITINQNNISLLREYLNVGSLADYLGLPSLGVTTSPDTFGEMRFSQLPFRAFQMIYDEYYRDQNLSNPVLDESSYYVGGDIGDTAEDIQMIQNLMSKRYCCWEKDYFTSALPNSQRGVDVGIPITGDVEISYDDSDYTKATLLRGNTGQELIGGVGNAVKLHSLRNVNTPQSGYLSVDGVEGGVNVDNSGQLKGTLSNILATINDLRLSEALQRWAEASMRGGARYKELLLSMFGVRSRDSRLDRPEFLQRFKMPVTVSEVLQTSSTISSGDDASPQGNMSGHAIGYGNSKRLKVYCEEHCIIMGIMSILPRSSYMQGMSRFWTKFDKFDFYFPQFAHLGEQALNKRELFYNFGTDYDDESTNGATFGYQSRYSEYKFHPNEVHGEFKTTLDSWHLGREFASAPNLNSRFVSYEGDARNIQERIFNAGSSVNETLWIQLVNHVHARRPMPYFGTPRL